MATCVLVAALTTLSAVAVYAAPPQPTALTAAAAHSEIAAGRVVWDLRSTGALIPGAVRLPVEQLGPWVDAGDVPTLSVAVSAAGINLSARVLLVADDDAQAQALARRLAPLASGSVQWLAGGMAAWQAAGLPVAATSATRLPVPQRLTALRGEVSPAAPADASRRSTATFAMFEPTTHVAAGLGPR